MFSTLLIIFIALNVISTAIIMAACVVSGSTSRRMETAKVLASSYDARVAVERGTQPAASYTISTQAQVA